MLNVSKRPKQTPLYDIEFHPIFISQNHEPSQKKAKKKNSDPTGMREFIAYV